MAEDGEVTILSARNMHSGERHTWTLRQEGTAPRKLTRFLPRVTRLGHIIGSVLLPAGYPGSVAREYLEFQIYDTLQALCSYLRGILATQAVFEGIGVGSSACMMLHPLGTGKKTVIVV